MAVEVSINFKPAYAAVDFSPADMSRLANAAMAGMEPYVRFDTGNLNATAHVVGDTVVYDAPYAAYPFENTHNRVTKTGHPRAAARWDKAYAASGMPELVEEAVRIVYGG